MAHGFKSDARHTKCAFGFSYSQEKFKAIGKVLDKVAEKVGPVRGKDLRVKFLKPTL